MLCAARMSSSKYAQLYTLRLLVPVAGKDNHLKKVSTHYNHFHAVFLLISKWASWHRTNSTSASLR